MQIMEQDNKMKRLIYSVILITIQHLTFNFQSSVAQAPFSTPDNISSGNCLDFGIANEFVTVPYSASLQPTDITLEMWINQHGPTVGTSSASIINHRNGFGTTWYSWAVFVGDGGNINVHTEGPSTWSDVTSVPVGTIQQNQWYHFAFTYNATTTQTEIYVNGVLTGGQITGNQLHYQANMPTRIGEWNKVGTSNPFNGQIDEVRIWNTARTQTQIRDNMCQPLLGNEAGLVGYWNMNEGTGATVNDITANANHGTRQ